MGDSLEYKMGQLEGRLASVESDLDEIKKCTKQISNTLTKGKGVFIGLLVAASSAGAFLSELIKRWSN